MKKLMDLPDHSRLWIYTSNVPLEGDLKSKIEGEMEQFVAQWSSHGSSMDATAEIVDKYFLIIGLDETSAGASGCGIDKSVKKIQELESNLGIQLLNRQWVAYDKDSIELVPLHQFWAMRKAELIGGKTMIYNSLVKNISEFRSQWHIPFELSWHKEMWGR